MAVRLVLILLFINDHQTTQWPPTVKGMPRRSRLQAACGTKHMDQGADVIHATQSRSFFPDQAHHLHPSCLSMFQSLNADAFDQVRLTEVVGKHDAKSLVVRRSYLRCCVSIRVQTQQRTVRKAVLSFLNYFAAVDWFRLTLRLLSLRSLQYFAFLLSKSQILLHFSLTMKSTTTLTSLSALLVLASAAPNQPWQHSKRALCTSTWGFQYWCASGSDSGSSSTSIGPLVPAPTSSAEPSAAPTPTGGSGGGSSTGGSSGYSSGSTADDITSDTGCTPLTVIFARGTVRRSPLPSSLISPTLRSSREPLS